MTRSDRVLRVFVRLGIGAATAACGLGLSGELVGSGGNAGVLAAQILGAGDQSLLSAVREYKAELRQKVLSSKLSPKLD